MISTGGSSNIGYQLKVLVDSKHRYFSNQRKPNVLKVDMCVHTFKTQITRKIYLLNLVMAHSTLSVAFKVLKNDVLTFDRIFMYIIHKK